MELETPTKNLHIGGFGCKMCRFWKRYEELQVRMLRLPQNGELITWGRCFNNENIVACLADDEAFRDNSKNRSNVDVERLSEDTVIMSTTENYGCKKFRGLKEKNNADSK